MNLVVVYTVEDAEECIPHEAVECLRYESREAFLAEFDKQIRECLRADRDYRVAQAAWMQSQPNPSKVRGRKKIEAAKASYDKDMLEWQAKRPCHSKMDVEIEGAHFMLWNFYHLDPMTGEYSENYTPPKVYELNEWFQKNLKKK